MRELSCVPYLLGVEGWRTATWITLTQPCAFYSWLPPPFLFFHPLQSSLAQRPPPTPPPPSLGSFLGSLSKGQSWPRTCLCVCVCAGSQAWASVQGMCRHLALVRSAPRTCSALSDQDMQTQPQVPELICISRRGCFTFKFSDWILDPWSGVRGGGVDKKEA